jgi:hypothetical protein
MALSSPKERPKMKNHLFLSQNGFGDKHPRFETLRRGLAVVMRYRIHSAFMLTNRCLYLRKFFWLLEYKSIICCSVLEMRQFFACLTDGHKDPKEGNET